MFVSMALQVDIVSWSTVDLQPENKSEIKIVNKPNIHGFLILIFYPANFSHSETIFLAKL